MLRIFYTTKKNECQKRRVLRPVKIRGIVEYMLIRSLHALSCINHSRGKYPMLIISTLLSSGVKSFNNITSPSTLASKDQPHKISISLYASLMAFVLVLIH